MPLDRPQPPPMEASQPLKTALVVVNELGYLPFDPERAHLLFQFFAERYDTGSVLVTTDLVFARWTRVFGDERMTAALLDRLTFRGHVPIVTGERYRLRASLRRQAAGASAEEGR